MRLRDLMHPQIIRGMAKDDNFRYFIRNEKDPEAMQAAREGGPNAWWAYWEAKEEARIERDVAEMKAERAAMLAEETPEEIATAQAGIDAYWEEVEPLGDVTLYLQPGQMARDEDEAYARNYAMDRQAEHINSRVSGLGPGYEEREGLGDLDEGPQDWNDLREEERENWEEEFGEPSPVADREIGQ